ncbi:MAG: UPF0758 domain-containing protein [Candidatus Saccharimonadales bacterium]
MKAMSYLRPREKLQQKGATVLTNAELLQVMIGSGNAQASVSRIAKRSMKQLLRYGNEITYDQLHEVAGLGPARACQILAGFELASRYPVRRQQIVIDTREKVLALVADIRSATLDRLDYITIDGAKRLIAKRSVAIVETAHPSTMLRQIFSDVVTDKAVNLSVVIGSSDRELEPSMFDLSLGHDLKIMAQLFNVGIQDYVIINNSGHRTLELS